MTETDWEKCPTGIKHEEQIITLFKQVTEQSSDIKVIKERLLARPSWAVLVAISFLSTFAFSVLTFALTVLRNGGD